jgi:hypothetical protein
MDVNGRLVEVQRRLSKQMIDPAKKPLPVRQPNLTRRLARISAINPVGGRCQIEINTKLIDGVVWLSEAYNPVVNDLVWVLFDTGREPIILGRAHNGMPAETSRWITIAGLNAGWTLYPGYTLPKYKKVNGIVFLTNCVLQTATPNTVAFTLPQGYWPGWTWWGAGFSGCEWYVNSVGNVVPITANTNLYACSGSWPADG